MHARPTRALPRYGTDLMTRERLTRRERLARYGTDLMTRERLTRRERLPRYGTDLMTRERLTGLERLPRYGTDLMTRERLTRRERLPRYVTDLMTRERKVPEPIILRASNKICDFCAKRVYDNSAWGNIAGGIGSRKRDSVGVPFVSGPA